MYSYNFFLFAVCVRLICPIPTSQASKQVFLCYFPSFYISVWFGWVSYIMKKKTNKLCVCVHFVWAVSCLWACCMVCFAANGLVRLCMRCSVGGDGKWANGQHQQQQQRRYFWKSCIFLFHTYFLHLIRLISNKKNAKKCKKTKRKKKHSEKNTAAKEKRKSRKKVTTFNWK